MSRVDTLCAGPPPGNDGDSDDDGSATPPSAYDSKDSAAVGAPPWERLDIVDYGAPGRSLEGMSRCARSLGFDGPRQVRLANAAWRAARGHGGRSELARTCGQVDAMYRGGAASEAEIAAELERFVSSHPSDARELAVSMELRHPIFVISGGTPDTAQARTALVAEAAHALWEAGALEADALEDVTRLQRGDPVAISGKGLSGTVDRGMRELVEAWSLKRCTLSTMWCMFAVVADARERAALL